MTRLQTRPLHENFGLEVLDVDLSAVDDAQYREILALWQEQPLLLFRRQLLDEDQLVAFSERFGKLHVVRDYMNSRRHPEVMYVSNLLKSDGSRLGSLANSELNWHSDQSYRERPATGSIFQAVEMPLEQGTTAWCNGELAYRALPESLQTQLEGLLGESRYNGYEREAISEAEKQALREQYPPVRHPLVLTHPATGRKCLYLDISTTYRLEGMNDAQGAALIKELAGIMTRPEHVYAHPWRAGDVMLWDNARLCHRRDPIDPDVPRLAKRTTIYLRPEEFPVPA